MNLMLSEFNLNGSIEISVSFKQVQLLDEIESKIKQYVNPVINTVKEYVEQHGYKLNSFDSLNTNSVEILDMTYVYLTTITKK